MKEKNNNLLGILGAVLGAFIGAIPWILVYVYGNLMFSFLAFVIALTAFKGYTLLKGKVTKNTPVIIGVISVLTVIISTLIIIPCLLLAKKGFTVNIKSLISLYNSSTFVFAIIRDLVIAIIFTILGISGVINQIKAKGLDEEEVKEHSKKQNTLYTILIVIAIVISTVVGSIDTSDNKPNTKTKLYEISGLKITLPNDMLVYSESARKLSASLPTSSGLI